MTTHSWVELIFSVGLLCALSPLLGAYIAKVYGPKPPRVCVATLKLLEHRFKLPMSAPMNTREYAVSLLVFHLVGALLLYALLRCQAWLPFNPLGLGNVSAEVSFNTAISFVTNTNWQAYGGETTMSLLSQMAGLTVHNFMSAGVGLAVLALLARSFLASPTPSNFWRDLVLGCVGVLAPLAMALSLALVSQGVVQTFAAQTEVPWVETTPQGPSAERPPTQLIALGPVASQVAIKQLGTNGGGFFNVNAAHPFENSTPASNAMQWLAILLIPAALCFSFGRLINDRRQGHALFATMLLLFIPLCLATVNAEQQAAPRLAEDIIVDQGNSEGKETRFGVTSSALWAVATTAASNGSVNSMHDSFTPLGGMVPMWLMLLGEVVFGGVGSGLYGLLLYAILAVFIAGLMVGRTPEYLGKKIEVKEMRLAMIALVLPSLVVLLGLSAASRIPSVIAALGNTGAQGLSELLYAFASGANNNGSAFAGLTASGPFLAVSIGVAMWIGRFSVILCVIALAGSLGKKQRVPVSLGTLPTHTPMFVGLLVATIILLAALTFLPALALGPIVEHLQWVGGAK